jgi:hypothetical protein
VPETLDKESTKGVHPGKTRKGLGLSDLYRVCGDVNTLMLFHYVTCLIGNRTILLELKVLNVLKKLINGY